MQQRGRICRDLLAREPWDLFLTVLGETHSALHELWAGSDPRHPVHETCRVSGCDRLLNVFKAVDQTVNSLAEQADPNTNFVLFSVHGMQANATDLPCLFFLAELMYRLNFPGQAALAAGDPAEPPPPPVTSGFHHHWFGEIWRRRHFSNKLLRAYLQSHPAWLLWFAGRDLRFPYFMNPMGAENGWMPVLWYRPSWPRMRSFAIPAFADGHIRINLQGREARGIVPPEEFGQECDRITRLLLRVRNSRTGEPVVRQVFRTRKGPGDDDPRLPPADLIVQWDDRAPFDLIESPEVGRIGPVPYFRTGGHRPGGFAMLRGPGIPAGSTLATADIFDLPVTLLQMLRAPIPLHFPGKSLLDLPEISSPPLPSLSPALVR
jgi:predicted AlkP superfamily phosphohydrolase/phosphomutase